MNKLLGNVIREHHKYIEYVGKKNKPKPKMFVKYKNNNLFNLPKDTSLLIMSDIHSITSDVVDDLIKKKIINKNTYVFSCGDMAGRGNIGGDGNPYDSYLNIKNNSKGFYFVQGNHDAYDERCLQLKNDDNTLCHVEGILQETPLGTISGVNGIYIENDKTERNKHKIREKLYKKRLGFVLNLKPDILLTHMPFMWSLS